MTRHAYQPHYLGRGRPCCDQPAAAHPTKPAARPCDACERRPGRYAIGPTWILCRRCLRLSDAYERANGRPPAPIVRL